MKNVILFLVFVGFCWWAWLSVPEIMHKIRVNECYKAQEICTLYWNTHGGKCRECEMMKQCTREGAFNE